MLTFSALFVHSIYCIFLLLDALIRTAVHSTAVHSSKHFLKLFKEYLPQTIPLRTLLETGLLNQSC